MSIGTTSTPTPSEIRITCPQCGGPSSFAKSNVWRPFCSERCKLIDLGAWGNEDFRIGSNTPPDLGDDQK